MHFLRRRKGPAAFHAIHNLPPGCAKPLMLFSRSQPAPAGECVRYGDFRGRWHLMLLMARSSCGVWVFTSTEVLRGWFILHCGVSGRDCAPALKAALAKVCGQVLE